VAGVSRVETTAPPTLAGALRARRAAMVVGEVAAVALGLFDQRGAEDATVGEIATGADRSGQFGAGPAGCFTCP